MISRYSNWNIEFKDTDSGPVMQITVSLDESEVDAQPSRSGKTLILATTGKPQPISSPAGEYFLGLNVFRYPRPRFPKIKIPRKRKEE